LITKDQTNLCYGRRCGEGIPEYRAEQPETGPFRPLLFNTGYTIAKTSFTSLSSSADWMPLTAHGIPGYTSTRAFIWPSNGKPLYNSNVSRRAKLIEVIFVVIG